MAFFTCGDIASYTSANKEVCSGDETIIVDRYIDTIDIH